MGEQSSDGMMGQRGVTRPMAERDLQKVNQPNDADGQGREERKKEEQQPQHEAGHTMSREDRLPMLHMHHKQTLWVYWTLPMLAVWLLLAPWTFGYLNPELWVDPSGGRGPWFATESTAELRALRAWLMVTNDLVCGTLLLICGWRSLTPNRPKSLWTCCFVGV